MDEDGAGASFAGIHETRLAVPLEGLADAVAAVARSPLAPRARAYREQLGLRPASEPCAVVVQVMVDASCAGVAFSRGSNEVVIEAVEGLGEVAMSGEAVPEMSVMGRTGNGWRVLRRSSRRQREAVRMSGMGVRRVPVECPAPPEPRPRWPPTRAGGLSSTSGASARRR
jgi:phosphoenolpyruvate synthase/pyruvate phosphate dikinase